MCSSDGRGLRKGFEKGFRSGFKGESVRLLGWLACAAVTEGF